MAQRQFKEGEDITDLMNQSVELPNSELRLTIKSSDHPEIKEGQDITELMAQPPTLPDKSFADRAWDVISNPDNIRTGIATGIRGASAFVPGGPLGALAGGLGEAAAQTIEPRESYNFPQMGVQTALGAIPFGRVASIGKGMLKGGALGLAGTTGTELAESGELPSLGQLALGGGLGAIGGGITGKFAGKENIPEPIFTERPSISEGPINFATKTEADLAQPETLTAADKLRESLKEVPAKIKEQEIATTAERAKKFGEIGEVETPGRAGYYEELGKLKGEVPKVTGTPLKLETSEIDELYDSIKATIPDKPMSIRARGAVEKLMRGEIPQQNELETLESYLEFVSDKPGTAKQLTARSKLREVYELTRGFMAVDLPFLTSAAFRQSAPLAGKANWFKAFAQGAKSFSSEGTYNAIMDNLQKNPLHRKRFIGSKVSNIADEIGLAQSDLKTLTNREEQIRSTLAEKIPIWGRYVKSSNRAFTAFQNTIRTLTAEDWLKAANAIDDKGNIIDMVNAKKIANTINELTGHGSLKVAAPFSRFTKSGKEYNLEKAADALSLIFWSPRLMARDMRMMNPLNYVKTDKLDRMKYLEGAVRRAGVWATFTGLAGLAGASVNSDPTSSDFGKARIGDTRLDAGTGLLQWIVLSARQALGGRTSSAAQPEQEGKFREFGSNIVSGTRESAFEEFMKNRIHPTLGLPISALSATKSNPFYPMSEGLERLTPIPAQDIIDLMESNPELGQIIMGLVGSAGAMGASTYGARDFGKPQFEVPGDVPFEGGSFLGR